MINININKSIKCKGDYSAFISFKYDPEIVSIIKSQVVRYYNPDNKTWEIPVKNIDLLKDDLINYNLVINDKDNILNEYNQTTLIENLIPKDYQFKIKPFRHQVEGINYGLNYDKFLLGDEQGLRKNNASYKYCLYQKTTKRL